MGNNEVMHLQESFSSMRVGNNPTDSSEVRQRKKDAPDPSSHLLTDHSTPTTATESSVNPLNGTSSAQTILDVGQFPSLLDYFYSQLQCPNREKPASEDSARIRVYNTLFRVPWHLERFIWFGVLSCLDALLMLMTVLPLRVALSFHQQRIQSGALFDAIRCCVLVLCVWLHVVWIEPGMLYFGMKDVTAEFLKITLVYVALDVADKIMCNVGVDMTELLMESCTCYCSGQSRLWSVILDSLMFGVMAYVHSLVVMSLAMVWYVSMESEKAIFAFMVISNFGEIKTTVFKRFDSKKLFILCRMDIVERVDLLIAAVFIVVEDLGQAGQWSANRDLLIKCTLILFLESIVDLIKHSVVVNLNGVRPGIYREFLRDVAQSLVSQGVAKKLIFEPLGPCILLLRVFFSALSIGGATPGHKSFIALLSFLLLFLTKVLLGWCLHVGAVWYQSHFQRHYGDHVKSA